MRAISELVNNRKGIALIASYLVIAVLIIFTIAFVNASIGQNNSTNLFKRQMQAFNLAEGGLDHAINWLRAQPSPPIGNTTNPWGGVQSLGTGLTYSVTINDLGAQGGNASIRRYKIVSTGTAGNISQILINNVQNDNYARYIWFTDSETYGGTNVWFWSLDVLNGPTQTNSHFNIYRDPVFTGGDVRSVDDYIRFYNNGNNINLSQSTNPPFDNPNFTQGITLGSEPVTMPNQALNLRSASTNGGLRLNGNSTVVLNANGTMNVTNSARGWTNRNMALPANGALFVNNGTLTISGTLQGRLTAGASSNLIIPNNITYSSDPRINSSSADMLGLISESNVMISQTAPAELEIDASLMALSTSFYLQNWSTVAPKGTLNVYGGIIQDQRGPVGTFNGSTGQKISGYSKNYNYDPRMLTTPPPFYPTTGDYVTLSWEN